MGLLRFGGHEMTSRQECVVELPPGGVEDMEFAALEGDRYSLEIHCQVLRQPVPTRGRMVARPAEPLTVVVLDPRRSIVVQTERVGQTHAVGFYCSVTGNHLLLLDGSRLTQGVRLRLSLERHVHPGPV